MKRFICIVVLLFALTALLGGCNSKSVSKTFDSDVETVWAAALKTAEKVSEEKPSKVDIENRKIITGWAYVNITSGHGENLNITRSTDIWRGIIKCEKDGKGTKVSVSVQKGKASTEDTAGPTNQSDNTLTVQLNNKDTSLQNKFLSMLEEELAPKPEEKREHGDNGE